MLRTDGSVPFLFGKDGFGVVANCSVCGTEATLFISADPVCSSFSDEACAILYALCWSRQHQQVCHFSSLLLLSGSHSVLSSIFSFTLVSGRNCVLSSVLFLFLFCFIRLQWVSPDICFFPGNDSTFGLTRRGALLVPLRNPL